MQIRSRLRQWGLQHCPGLYNFYSECVRLSLPNRSMICNGPGFKIRVESPRQSVIARSIYRKGIWEPEMTSMAKEKIKPGWHILDVGAHIGYYTLLFGTLCGPEGRVAAFEPIREDFSRLQGNIELNGQKNICPFQLALSNHPGHAVMKDENRGQMLQDEEGDPKETVDMVSFDEFWPTLKWSKLDLVKIDVEGAEMSVLDGMKKVLEQYHPHLFVEIHPLHLRKVFNSSAEDVVRLLKEKYHYHLIPVDSDSLDIREDNVTIWCE